MSPEVCCWKWSSIQFFEKITQTNVSWNEFISTRLLITSSIPIVLFNCSVFAVDFILQHIIWGETQAVLNPKNPFCFYLNVYSNIYNTQTQIRSPTHTQWETKQLIETQRVRASQKPPRKNLSEDCKTHKYLRHEDYYCLLNISESLPTWIHKVCVWLYRIIQDNIEVWILIC